MNSSNELLAKIEAARIWGYFHKDWLLQMRVEIRQQLPPEYRVFVESEAVIISPDPDKSRRVVLPDVAVTREPVSAPQIPTRATSEVTATVVEAEEPCEIETHYSLIIRRVPENRVVAAIELLSPSNKGIGNRLDEQKHLRKRDDYLDAGVSLLEIDALTEGRRTLPAAVGQLAEYERIAWNAIYDSGRRCFRGWGWNAEDSLPTINWKVEPDYEVLIDTEETLRAAAAFNDWDSLLSNPKSH